METIAPLAKILAEANGIDWRSIRGTGSGNQITEKDILTHLAGIMSGEIEPPSTPVDPEPSPAELAAAAATPEMLSRAGVDAELADLMKQQAQQIAEAHPAASLAASAAVSADDFELDDEDDAPLSDPAPATPAPEQPAPSVQVYQAAPAAFMPEDASTPKEGAELLSTQPAERHSEVPYGAAASSLSVSSLGASGLSSIGTSVPSTPVSVTPPAPAAEPAPGLSAGGVLGGLLSSLYRRSAPAPTAAVTALAESTAVTPPIETVAAQPQPAQPEPVPPTAPEMNAAEALAPAPIAQVYQPETVSAPVAAEHRAAESFSEPLPPAPALGEPLGELPQPSATQAPQAPADAAPAAAPQSAPAAWSGTYLRRDLNLSAALAVQQQLSEVLGDLPLTLLLARAAQRHVQLLGLSNVTLANAQGQALDADLSGNVRAGLVALQAAAPRHEALSEGKSSELLILDAAALDLDDLHYSHAVTLSLGRVRDGKAALSLNGTLDVQGAARFLAEVSALMATPVKLLV